MSNTVESWDRVYVAPDSGSRSKFQPPPPAPWHADQSFLGKDAPGDLESMTSERAFQLQQRQFTPPSPLPWHSEGHPSQRIDQSFSGKDAPKDLDVMTSELVFQKQQRKLPPPPWHSAGHPNQGADQSFLGKDAPGDLDPMASELAFQMQQRQQFRKQFVKTQFCRYHLSSGCRKGATCEFAHDSHELTRPPDLRRTSICKDWLEGKCQATDENCRFAHGNALLRRTLGDENAHGYRPATASSEFTAASASAAAAAAAAAAGSRRNGAAKLFTTWEQQLLKQQVEQEQMKETIRAQQKIIDALLSLQTSGMPTPGQQQHPAVPQMSKNKIQSGMPTASMQGFPTDAIEYPQQVQKVVPQCQYSERMLPSNGQGFSTDAMDAVQMQKVVPQYPERMLTTDAIDAEQLVLSGIRL